MRPQVFGTVNLYMQLFRKQIVIPLSHLGVSRQALSRLSLSLCVLALVACKVHAQVSPGPPGGGAKTAEAHQCLPTGNGFLRARLAGALAAELDWGNEGLECTGAVRPTDGGIRMRFARAVEADDDVRLVIVFGIAKLQEGQPARAVPVNVTLVREGAGEFYGTQGDDKCMLDRVSQEPLVGIPHRARSYRIVARGFCTEPARAVHGSGAVLLSRFDFAGRVDFETEDTDDAEALMVSAEGSTAAE